MIASSERLHDRGRQILQDGFVGTGQRLRQPDLVRSYEVSRNRPPFAARNPYVGLRYLSQSFRKLPDGV